MTKRFRKKNVLLRSGKKKKKATISIHKTRHRWYRIKQDSYMRYLKKKGLLPTV